MYILVVIPSKSPVFLPQLPSMPIQQKITPATPRIVIARAEGQRIEPNSASIISNLAAQHQPKPSNGANSYVALDDFLNRKFGSSNNGNSQVSNSVDQHFKQIGIQIPKVQVPPQFQTAAATQTKYAAYQNSVQPHLNHFQQNLNPSFQQQVQSNNYQTTLNLQNPAHSQPVYQQQHQTFSINPKNSIPQKHSNAPFATQNIFANFHQQQQQLPQFPPLAQGSARSSNINSNHGYLNVQLPVLPKGLIPAPTTQVAQKRSDNFEAEYAIPTSRLRATPRFLHYNVVSSYDVPLSSVGRLSNDITKVTRRLRKY